MRVSGMSIYVDVESMSMYHVHVVDIRGKLIVRQDFVGIASKAVVRGQTRDDPQYSIRQSHTTIIRLFLQMPGLRHWEF
jgi:hypothetical protein